MHFFLIYKKPNPIIYFYYSTEQYGRIWRLSKLIHKKTKKEYYYTTLSESSLDEMLALNGFQDYKLVLSIP
jgi:hypothetical protein